MQVTTIIPTLCQLERREQILRAIKSIKRAATAAVRILVVVNGQRFDRNLVNELQARGDVDLLQISEGSVVKAQLFGRQAVATPYFSFLDDDDEYLPGALDLRLEAFSSNPEADVVVTNGFAGNRNGADRILYERLQRIQDDPLLELFEENWLASCNHLFKSETVTEVYFQDAHPYIEWTWRAFKLAMDSKSIIALDTPTFRYNDTPGSLSKSVDFTMSRTHLYHRMLREHPGRKAEDVIRRRLSSAWHDISVSELAQQRTRGAIKAHINSLFAHWTGLRYLTYSRHLLR